MKVDYAPVDGNGGVVRRLFKKLLREKPPQLFGLVKIVLDQIKQSKDLEFLRGNGCLEKLPNSPLFVLKIPVKNRSGGVVRLYFGYRIGGDEPGIIIFSGEKKTKLTDNKVLIGNAEQMYKEYCESLKKKA